MRSERGNFTLIGLLVAVVIIIVAAVFYLGRPQVTSVKSNSELLDQHSKKQTVVGKSLDTAKGAECRQRLDQIRKGIETYKAMNESGANPPSLKDIGLSVGGDYFQCPLSGKPYSYDPSTGQVFCQYEGHKGY